MQQYTHWADSLAEHASDADARKSWDPGESPRHYVDLENFPGFLSSGRVIQTVDSAYQVYGSTFLYYNGSLPYTTLITYDSLVSAFEHNDLRKVMYYAGDIGHYVADGHMPFHLTRNYDGQYSDQDGVHYRVESRLITSYLSQITYSGSQVNQIQDVNAYVFNYIYTNYPYVDSLLNADSAAYAAAGTYYGSSFYSPLWAQTSGQIISLFRNASHAIAELIYTAWLEAGSPSMISDRKLVAACPPEVFPVPVVNELNIRFQDDANLAHHIRLIDAQGRELYCALRNGNNISVNTAELEPGIYNLVVLTGSTYFAKKIVILH
jgi:hypothetical protein